MKEIEDKFIDFIPNFNSNDLLNWLKVLHNDPQLRKRVEKRYKERMVFHQMDIKRYEQCLKIIGRLDSSNPNWEKMKWELGAFQALP